MIHEISYTRSGDRINIKMTGKPLGGAAIWDACNLSETEKRDLRRWLGTSCEHGYISDLIEAEALTGILTRCEDCRKRVLIHSENGKRYLVEQRPPG